MEDPVLLPTSNTIIDRSTIRAHLLSDTRDPFSRAPLSMDMVIPGKIKKTTKDGSALFFYFYAATDIKEKIQAWRAEQKRKRTTASSGGNDPMDTST